MLTRRQNNLHLQHLCEAGRCSFGESPRSPPLENTSLHRRNNNVNRPWGILSLFTKVSSPCQSLTQTCCKSFVKQVGFFSHGESPRNPPLEGTSLHRRKNNVHRPWGILSLFKKVSSPCQSLTQTCCKSFVKQVGFFSYGESPRNPPLEGTSLHRRNNNVNRPWGILSLFTKVSSPCQSLTQTCCKSFVKQVGLFSFFLTANHRGPLPLRELHSIGETIM